MFLSLFYRGKKENEQKEDLEITIFVMNASIGSKIINFIMINKQLAYYFVSFIKYYINS